jgi:hypothetical protein
MTCGLPQFQLNVLGENCVRELGFNDRRLKK